MKYLLIIAILLTQIFAAQNKRFIFEYKFIPDSTDRSKITKEIMFLDVTKDHSLFYSHKKFASDSTLLAESKKGKFSIPSMDLTVLYQIEKIDGKIFLKTSEYDLGKVKIQDRRTFDWHILSDKEKVGAFDAQKAVTEFAGRKWIVWFATDIPIQEGPYKFYGLPGLIVKIEDTTGSHSMTLVGITNIAADFVYPDFDNRNEKLITQQEFTKYYRNFRRDPAVGIRQQYIQGSVLNYGDRHGNISSGFDAIKRIEKTLKDRLEKDNNIIELDLLSVDKKH